MVAGGRGRGFRHVRPFLRLAIPFITLAVVDLRAGIDPHQSRTATWFLRDLRTPFGGSKQSGIGREGGIHSLEFYTELRNVCVAT